MYFLCSLKPTELRFCYQGKKPDKLPSSVIPRQTTPAERTIVLALIIKCLELTRQPQNFCPLVDILQYADPIPILTKSPF